MIRHVVVITGTPEAADAQKRGGRRRASDPAAADEGLLNYSFGPDAGTTDGNASFAIVVGF